MGGCAESNDYVCYALLQGNVQEVLFRYEVVLQNNMSTAAFLPRALSDGDGANTIQKHAVLGACFMDHFDKLPLQDCRLVWECTFQATEPVCYKPFKPKM